MSKGYSIKTQKESVEFLNLQIYGRCCEEFRKGFTKVNITEKAKNLFKPIADFIYFGDEKLTLTTGQLTIVHQVLSKLRANVSKKEIDLVNHIAQCINRGLDMKFLEAQLHYYRQYLSPKSLIIV